MADRLGIFLSKLYLLILGIAIGAILAAGMMSAPIIFNANDYLAETSLTRYESGLIMTQIFLKLNALLNLTAVWILIHETIYYRYLVREWFAIVCAVISVVSILLFTLYYTPAILDFQMIGPDATAGESFDNAHKGSEMTVKILLLGLVGLFLMRSDSGKKKD